MGRRYGQKRTLTVVLTLRLSNTETQYFGRAFQMGSLISGTTTGATAVNGFKIVVANDGRGAIAIQGVCGPDPKFVGSAKYTAGKVSGENRVGQNGNVAI
jgi:hypothetical protein